MNIGLILRWGLVRAALPIDVEHVELGRQLLNDNIQELWYKLKPDFRHSRGTIDLVIGSDEYVLNKLFDGFVPNSMRGPVDNPRTLTYKDPIEFFRITRNQLDSTGDPVIYTFGDFSGVDKQLIVAQRIDLFSSLANTTSGTMKVVNGSETLESSEAVFSLNDVGLRFQRSGDTRTYKIGEFLTSTSVKLDEKYRGVTGSAVTYKVGDIGIHANVQGFVGGQIDSEDVILDGSATVTTVKTFQTVTSVSKADFTGGRVTARSNDGVVVVSVLAPQELEIERQTVIFWRIPSTAETLSHRFYMKHPLLRLDTDRSLLPTKYHNILRDMTTSDLLEYADRPVPAGLGRKILEGMRRFEADADDSSLWQTVPREEGLGFGLSNVNDRRFDSDFAGIF